MHCRKKNAGDAKNFFGGGYSQQSQTTYDGVKIDFEPKPKYCAFFSSARMKSGSQNFTGGKAFAMFGSCVVDLTGIAIRSNVEFEASAVMGKVQIMAPRNARVFVNGTPVLGAYDMKLTQLPDAEYPVFKITGVAVMGCVEVI